MRTARVFVFLVLIAAPASAQDGGSQYFLSLGAGNRALGMGGAYGAISDDASAPLWNPGGLGLLSRAQFQASRTSYGLDMNEEYLGLALPSWRWGTLGATVRHFGTSGIDGRDAGNFQTDDFSSSEMQLALSYGRKLGEAWNVGTSLKLLSQELAGATASGVGLDAGIIAFPGLVLGSDAAWERRLSIGLSVHNLVEPSLRLDRESVSDPMTTRLGMGYRHPFGSPDRIVTAAVDLEASRERDLAVFAGLDFKLLSALSLRAGLRDGSPTLGTQAQWHDIAFDYVFENTRLEAVHRFGISVAFGGTVDESRLKAERQEDEKLEARLNSAFSERQRAQTTQLVQNAENAFTVRRYDEALELLSVASVVSGDDASTRPLRLRCLLAKAKEEEGRSSFAEAAVTYGQAVTLDPENMDAVEGSERCRAESNRLAARSERIQAQFAKGLDAFTNGDFLAARGLFKDILSVQPSDTEASKMLERTEAAIGRRLEELEMQARGFIRAGLFSDAEVALAEATRLNPGSPSVDAMRATLTNAQNEAKRVRTEPTAPASQPNTVKTVPPRLTERQKEDMAKFYENGVAALKDGRTQDAIRYWEWVYSLDPGYRNVKENLKREHHLLGIQAFSEGRLTEAVENWETALKIDPQDAKTRAYLDRARQQLERSRAVTGAAGQ
jgi:tetratricopeptide (TPR) repeat protein